MTTFRVNKKTRKKRSQRESTHISQLVHIGLLLLLTFLYSGAFQFLFLLSRSLLYFFYALCFALIFMHFIDKNRQPYNFASLSPYFIWLLFYFMWGSLISNDFDVVVPQVIRAIFSNLLIATLILSAIRTQQDMQKFAFYIQLVAICNFILSLWMSFDPSLIIRFNQFFGVQQIGFLQLRPAGLWINPNAAAFAFIFALFLSYWSKGLIAWLGRLAAIGGVYLSVSRTGIYVLLFCFVLFLLFYLRSRAFWTKLVIVAGFAFILLGLNSSLLLDFNDRSASQFRATRLLDFSEEDVAIGGPISRRQLTTLALQQLDRMPWYGYGALSFQSYNEAFSRNLLPTGAHNIFIAVMGETGIVGIVSFLGLIILTIHSLLRSPIVSSARVIMLLMWTAYLLFGLAWHNQLTSVLGIMLTLLVFYLPHCYQIEELREVKSTHYL